MKWIRLKIGLGGNSYHPHSESIIVQACLDSGINRVTGMYLLSSGLERLSDKTPHLLGPSSIRLTKFLQLENPTQRAIFLNDSQNWLSLGDPDSDACTATNQSNQQSRVPCLARPWEMLYSHSWHRPMVNDTVG